jgi:hypothetical protein
MINLLRLVEGQQFAGEPEQKPGDQVRGTDQAVVKGKQHPFHDRLVGEDTTLEDVLSKKYSDFKDVQAKEKEEKEKQDVEEGAPIATTSKSIEPGGAVDNFKQQMANNTEIDYQKKQQGMAEAKADYNFSIEDLKRLEKIRDLPTLKAMAFALISAPSAKPMKPEKVEWFKGALERMNSPMKVIKLMYDLMLSGEGQSVIGTRSSMNPNSYRQKFGEQGMAEGSQRVDSLVTDALKIMKGSELSDAVSALKTVLGNREYNDRRGHYNFYVRQLMDMYGQQGIAEASNPADKISMDVPLLIRIMEYAREDAQTDMDLHDVAERLIELSNGGNTLSMNNYDDIVGVQTEQQVNELGATPVAPPQGTATAQPAGQPATANTTDGSISPDEQTALNKINQNPAMKQQLDKLMTQATPGGASAPMKLDQEQQDALNKIKSNAGLGTQYAKLIKQANPASNVPAVKP